MVVFLSNFQQIKKKKFFYLSYCPFGLLPVLRLKILFLIPLLLQLVFERNFTPCVFILYAFMCLCVAVQEILALRRAAGLGGAW